MSRVKNATFADIRKHVQDKVEFDSTTGNLFSCIYSYANRSNKRYVVFSYGGHWPLFVYDFNTDRWFENDDRYSNTTSKHRRYAHPLPPEGTTKLSLDEMRVLSDYGLKALAQWKMGGRHGIL